MPPVLDLLMIRSLLTGGGKTMMMAAILHCLDPTVKKVLMTRSLSLVSQVSGLAVADRFNC